MQPVSERAGDRSQGLSPSMKNRDGNHESPDTRNLFLLILLAAILTATLAIVQSSVIWAVLYLVGILLSCLVVIYSFCTKCPCRNTDCGHVIPGRLTRFFPRRAEGPYTFWDRTGIVVPIVFMTVFPQYWLLKQPRLFLPFCSPLPDRCCRYPVLCLQRVHQRLLPVLPGMRRGVTGQTCGDLLAPSFTGFSVTL